MTNVEMFVDPDYERVTIAQPESTQEWITADKSLLVAVEQ